MAFSDFFKALDYFGVQINFNFKSQKKYTSTCGASIFLIYVIICLAYISINSITFLQKKHKTVIHYDKELFATDEIYFHKYNSSFAINLICDNYDGKFGNIYSKFQIVAKHVQYLKNNGQSKKIKILLPLHKCTYEDFYNQFNEELDRNEITNQFYCIDNMNYTVKGIFADEDFEYFELTLSAIMNDDFSNKTYLDLLYEYDCKLSLYYIDSAVDVANVKQPMRPFLNSRFIQVSPTDFKKVNLFYTIKNFKSDENWFFTIPKEKNYLAFSSFEQYDVAKGDNRFIDNLDDCEKFARFFIRASTTRNMTERRYEKFTEFVASSISILSAILVFLTALLHKINYSLSLKEIVNTLCIEQKKNLEKKINLKTKLNSIKNIDEYKKKKNYPFLKEESNNINENEEISLTNNKLNKIEHPNNKKRKIKMAQSEGSLIKENDNICCDNSRSKVHLSNNLKLINAKRINIEINNCLINESKNESENFFSYISDGDKNRRYSHDGNNYKKSDFSGFLNNNSRINEENKLKKFQLSNRQRKTEFFLDNIKFNFNSNKIFNTKIKNKFTLLNNNIQASILSYKLCRLFSNCKKNNKNNQSTLENSLNYLTKNLDIFTYLKTIKNQDVLVNILFDSDNYDIFKKLESLHFHSYNIFDNDNIYIINKGKRRKSNLNNLDNFWKLFNKLINKANKTQTERRLIELIIKEINEV